LDRILGIHESALLYRARRMEVLATNLANADTPNFKARDVEFAGVMATFGDRPRVARTDARHISGRDDAVEGALRYRVPHQPALDGNTVESDLESARFAENAVAYQASLQFIDGRISTLRLALTGGR
jgi:flagellar basal-body rod protein FlgB